MYKFIKQFKKSNDDFKIEYIPLEKYGCGVRFAKDNIAKKVLSDFYQRSEQIKNDEFVEDEYAKFAQNMVNRYLLACSGYEHKLLIRILNNIENILPKQIFSIIVTISAPSI